MCRFSTTYGYMITKLLTCSNVCMYIHSLSVRLSRLIYIVVNITFHFLISLYSHLLQASLLIIPIAGMINIQTCSLSAFAFASYRIIFNLPRYIHTYIQTRKATPHLTSPHPELKNRYGIRNHPCHCPSGHFQGNDQRSVCSITFGCLYSTRSVSEHRSVPEHQKRIHRVLQDLDLSGYCVSSWEWRMETWEEMLGSGMLYIACNVQHRAYALGV